MPSASWPPRKDAGLTQIDHLITTHWHGDHFGGMAEVASRIPIAQFIDHGPNVQPQPAADEFLQKVYPTLYAQGEAHGREAGRQDADRRPRVADRAVGGTRRSTTPLPGAGGANPYCATLQAAGRRPERERAVGRQLHHVRAVSRRCTWAT